MDSKHKLKKRRRRSSEGDSRDDHREHKNADCEINLAHFSFLDHKSELTAVLEGQSNRHQLVQDIKDFWLFVHKYEATLKKSGNCVLPPVADNLDKLSSSFPTEYHRRYLNSLHFAVPVSEILTQCAGSRKLSPSHVKHFLQILLQYLDFRQKEKFKKLKKLKDSQSNLPVAAFKEEIVNAVRNERVVLLAGDTGCGKSTQVPQYLHEAGYKGIGK